MEIYFSPPKDFGKLLFHIKQLEKTDHLPWLKLYQNVYVTLRPKIVTKNRAKQCQFADVVAFAEIRHLFTRDFEP